VIEGASSASPVATTRTAGASCSGGDVLEQEAAGAGAERLVDVVVEVEGGEHENAGRRFAWLGKQAAGGFDAVESRHADVHQRDVEPVSRGELEHLGAVVRLGHDLDVGLGVEDAPEAAPHERLVVGDQHADAHGPSSLSGRRAVTRKPPPGSGPASSSPR
jgi:hypothetical protein